VRQYIFFLVSVLQIMSSFKLQREGDFYERRRREPDFDRFEERERRADDLREDLRDARRTEERRRRVFLPPK